MIKTHIKNVVLELQEKYGYVGLDNLEICTSLENKYYFVTISYLNYNNYNNEIIENIAVGAFEKFMKISLFRQVAKADLASVLMELPID